MEGMMERTRHTPSPLIYILVCLFGANASLATSALWVEYPALISTAPEGRSLVLYIVVLLEVSNIAPVAYLLAKRCANVSEVPFIYTTFALGVAIFILLGFCWDHNTEIVGRSHSFILLICTFFSSLITCISSVTYVPFTATLRQPFITGGLFGEGLGRLIAHVMGIAQGIGRKPQCIQEAAVSNASRVHRYSYYPRTTTPLPILEQRLRFDESYYFFLLSGVVGFCALCFVCLRCLPDCRGDATATGADTSMDTVEDVELASREDEELWQSEGVLVLDDGTIRHRNDLIQTHRPSPPPSRTVSGENSARKGPTVTRLTPHSVRLSTSSSLKSQPDPSIPRSFVLLMGITFWTSSILYGPLSPLKAYSCYPIGNMSFLIGAVISTVVTIITCPIALRIHDKSRITIVVALTSLGTILLTYFVALITFSHSTDAKDSPLFGSAGELLTTIAWIAITGLFSIAQVTIALLCRDASPKAVLWFSVIVAVGSAVGTICIVDNVSVCKVFRSYEKAAVCTV